MNKKEFDNILDDCLERLLVKGESLKQCLERYPAQADELKPLLETALAAREATDIQPPADFRAQARYQFHSALKEAAAGKSRAGWSWFPRWATVVAVVLVLVLVGGGTVYAAESSMPDSLLYPVKLATEQARLTLTFSQMDKARLCAEVADRRVTEIAYMANRGDAEQVTIITRRLDEKLDQLVMLIEGEVVVSVPGMLTAPPPEAGEAEPPPAPPPPAADEAPPRPEAAEPVPPVTITPSDEDWGGGRNGGRAQLKNTVVTDAASNRAQLREVLDEAPESARDALRRAIAVSDAGYEEVLEALLD